MTLVTSFGKKLVVEKEPILKSPDAPSSSVLISAKDRSRLCTMSQACWIRSEPFSLATMPVLPLVNKATLHTDSISVIILLTAGCAHRVEASINLPEFWRKECLAISDKTSLWITSLVPARPLHLLKSCVLQMMATQLV